MNIHWKSKSERNIHWKTESEKNMYSKSESEIKLKDCKSKSAICPPVPW